MRKPVLTFAEVACERGGRRLFKGINLRLKAGDCVELHGVNGSGKSTLLRAAAGLFTDYDGTVQAAPFHYLGHKHGVSALLSPLENLLMHERSSASDGGRTAAPEAGATADGAVQLGCQAVGGLLAADLDGATTVGAVQLGCGSAALALRQVGLGGLADRPCGQLSEGQRRRVALARLLLERRPLWLLDEPLTALDADGRSLVRDLVSAQCRAGGAVLCATHQPLGCPGAVALRLGGAA